MSERDNYLQLAQGLIDFADFIDSLDIIDEDICPTVTLRLSNGDDYTIQVLSKLPGSIDGWCSIFCKTIGSDGNWTSLDRFAKHLGLHSKEAMVSFFHNHIDMWGNRDASAMFAISPLPKQLPYDQKNITINGISRFYRTVATRINLLHQIDNEYMGPVSFPKDAE